LRNGYPIDDSLHQHHIYIDASRDIRKKFRDAVADGICGQTNRNSGCGGSHPLLAAGNIDIAELIGGD
jgi:hypothetical protein